MSKSETPEPHRQNENNTILVVGDWLVDEHWVVGAHRSRTSSRVGQVHYRSIQDSESTVTSFCGAGRTAAILHRAQPGRQVAEFSVVGLGVWHQDDTKALEAMLDSASVKGRTPHQITLSYRPGKKKVHLINLVDGHNGGPKPGTTKVIRIYQQTGSRVDLIERIDWEVKVPAEGWVTRVHLDHHTELNGFLAKIEPKAIVIKDMLKGVVSLELIEFLVRKLPNTPWFISSKEFLPTWIRAIPPDRIRLFEIPQAAVQDAVNNRKLDAWLTRLGKPSNDALLLLDRLGTEFPHALVVAVPNDQTVMAHRHHSPSPQGQMEKEGVIWTNPKIDPISVGLPMASVCFAAFTGYLLTKPALPLDKLVHLSLSFTTEWRSAEAGRSQHPLGWDPASEPRLELSATAISDQRLSTLQWLTALAEWQQAYTKYGVIQAGARGRIELLRAMTEVKNYVCIDSSKRDILRTVVREIEAFRRERGTRSCMIVAAPGSGKSLLAQLLAEDHGLFFLEFNITQLITKADILDCFDVILTSQFENRGRRVLVFVDEIDANLDGEPVYDAFLAPLERGVYRRAGKTFPLDPCFWLFAGTKDPMQAGGVKKASDFVSRLTLKPRVMEPAQNDEYRLENVYLGVALLGTEFPDVREVSTLVLEVFHRLTRETSVRELRQFIRDFVDIKSGEVRWENIPQHWCVKLGIGELPKPPVPETMIEVRGQVNPHVLARFTPESIVR